MSTTDALRSVFLRWSAVIEGTSYIVLLCAVLGRGALGAPNWASPLGSFHGAAFVVYFAAVIVGRGTQGWRWDLTSVALVAAVIPFGTFYVERRLMRG